MLLRDLPSLCYIWVTVSSVVFTDTLINEVENGECFLPANFNCYISNNYIVKSKSVWFRDFAVRLYLPGAPRATFLFVMNAIYHLMLNHEVEIKVFQINSLQMVQANLSQNTIRKLVRNTLYARFIFWKCVYLQAVQYRI